MSKKRLSHLISRLKNNMKYHAGYPINHDFEDSELHQLLTYHMNNIGDPFLLRSPFSTHEYEYEVIKWFLELYGLDAKTGWGYVTSGGTEGTLFGLWQGKELLDCPILYCAQSAHYSVYKASRLLGLELKMIACDQKGVLRYNEIERCVDKGRDAIFLATLGSTMTSSIDDVAQIKTILNNCGIHSYIHADAALDGMILPFINSPYPYKLTDGIDSVSISGHKLIGASAPCGVVLIQRQHINQISENISYINNMDCTLTGSRSGYAPLILWSKIKAKGYAGFKRFVQQCIQDAKRYTEIFNENEIKAWRFDHAITIVLASQPRCLLQKWRLPINDYYTTLTAFPKLTENMVNEIIVDIKKINLGQDIGKGIMLPMVTEDISLN